MKSNILLLTAVLASLPLVSLIAPAAAPTNSREKPGLSDRENLTAWCVVPFDAKKGGPEQRAEKLRTVQHSGWHGPIGLIAEQGGDAAVTLANNMRGLDWLRKELAHPGSRGQRPNFNVDSGIANPSVEGLPPRSLPTGPTALAPVDWVQTHLRIAHLPPADWRQIHEYFNAGYQVVAVNTLAQWDRVGPRAHDYSAPVVQEADAYLRRIVKIAHDAGGKAVFYLGPVQPALHSETFRAKHPDWLRVNEDGSRARDYVNFRNPEVVNWLCEQLAFLAREYQADGFWFDGYSPVALHTYDEATRQAFKAYSQGHDIPRKSDLNPQEPIARQYLQWHEAYFAEVAAKLRHAVREANPAAVVYGNYSANRTWYEPGWPMGEYPAYYANAIDLPSVELYWDNPGDALFQQFVYAFTQGVSHDRGARVWVQPHVHGTLGTPPATELMLRCLEGAPWGVYAEFVENAEREEYCHQYVAEAQAREEWWKQSEAVPYIGLVASEQTRLLLGKDTLPKYFSHTLGAFRALFEAHLPLRVLSEYDLENAELQGIQVLVLPDVRVLSDRSSEVIRRFVQAGGGLVATCNTGLFDPTLKPRPTFSLADLFHADYVETRELTTRENSVNLWLTAPEHPIVNDDLIKREEATAWRNPSDPPPERGALELVSSLTTVRPRKGSQTVVSLEREPAKAEAAPALLASTYGEGRVVYCAAGLDQAMFFYPNAFIGQMLVNAAKWVAGGVKPPIETDGPLMLSVTYRRQLIQHRTIVHLLNDQSSYGRHSLYQKVLLLDHSLLGPWAVRREVVPLHDIKVRCRVSGVRKATQQPELLSLPLQQLPDGSVEVVVPKINMYSLVVFE